MMKSLLALSLDLALCAGASAMAEEVTPPSRTEVPAAHAARSVISDPKVQETPADDAEAPPAHRSRTISSERAHSEPRRPATSGDAATMAPPVIMPQIRLPAGPGAGSAAGPAAKGAAVPAAPGAAAGRARGTAGAGVAAPGSSGAQAAPAATPSP